MMSDDEPRNLTNADAREIAVQLKKQIMEDFKLEVGAGILALVKKALFYILLMLAIYGVTQNQGFFANIHMGGRG
jgi:hypothetical protein